MSLGAEDVAVVMLSYSVTEEAGGPGVAAVGFASGLARLGFKVSLISFDSVGDRWLIDAARASERGFVFERVNAPSWPLRIRRLTRRAVEIGRNAGRREIVLWANGIWREQSVATALAARQLSSGYVVRPAGSLGHAALRYRSLKKASYYRLLERRILVRASALHCMSDLERSELPQELQHLAFVLPSGVDLPQSIPGRTPGEEGVLKVGVLARIHPIKRQLEVLDVVEKLLEAKVDIRLELAGSVTDRSYDAALRRRVEASTTLRGKVAFLGHVSHQDLPEVVGRWDAAFLLSEQENFGHALISAAALGVPTVSAPGVGISAAMEAAGAGIVANPDEAAAAMMQLLGAGRGERRRAALAFASRFSWDTCSRHLGERIIEVARSSEHRAAHRA